MSGRAGGAGRAPVRALYWRGGARGELLILDQTLLPHRVLWLRPRDAEAVYAAIRRLAVRGAPAVGVVAAYGVVLGLRAARAKDPAALSGALERTVERLGSSRPTAVNLFWALDRMQAAARRLLADKRGEFSRDAFLAAVLAEAKAIHAEDAELCRAIGRHGERLLGDGWGVLTHCNAGALATGGMGTALALVYAAAQGGKRLHVYADETRPLLQGARLTAWELRRAGLEVTVLCDSAAATLLRRGDVQCVVVGADRIARNGDVANKIGTYPLAVLARTHGVPFYVAAPLTTFDPLARTGADIPIEERAADEVVATLGRRTAPRGVVVFNPAFDVTPARYVTAIVTDAGVIRPPFRRAITRLLGGRAGHPGR